MSITHSVSVCDWWSVRELSVVLNPSVTPYIWERTRKITLNPLFPSTHIWMTAANTTTRLQHAHDQVTIMHNSPNKMSRAFTSICWLLHQGQMIIILQHSKNKICICIKCALNGIMHARVMKYSKEKCTGIILIYFTTCLFSSFASRALTVQFEQLTHILSCITLSLTGYLLNMNFGLHD